MAKRRTKKIKPLELTHEEIMALITEATAGQKIETVGKISSKLFNLK